MVKHDIAWSFLLVFCSLPSVNGARKGTKSCWRCLPQKFREISGGLASAPLPLHASASCAHSFHKGRHRESKGVSIFRSPLKESRALIKIAIRNYWCTNFIANKKAVQLAYMAATASVFPRTQRALSATGDEQEKLTKRRQSKADVVSRAFTFWRHVGPIVLHYKFTEFWLVATNADFDHRGRVWEKLHNTHSPQAMDVILELRGLYVKIGQVLSSRPDFVPRQYVDRFCSLQDTIPPWPVEKVKIIARESLHSVQGLEFTDVFEKFEDEALGSASIGQVHRAVLKPQFESLDGYAGGKIVAVKVMHPSAESCFANDFKVFKWLCRIALPGWKPILSELERQMMTEFDYSNEAASLEEVRGNIANSAYAKSVKIPEPVMGLCSKNLLVMEMLEGKKLAESIEDKLAAALGGDKQLARDVLKAKQQQVMLGRESRSKENDKNFYREMKLLVGENVGGGLLRRIHTTLQLVSMVRQARATLDLLIDIHGYQIFVNGVFNGDPHPGNILELTDGRLGLIDYGQVRRLDSQERVALSKVVVALGKEDVVDADIAGAMRDCGFQTELNKDDILAKTAALFFDSDVAGRELGYATPQLYLQYLLASDPLVNVPDAAVFVARTSFLFRGMGALLQQQLRTAKRWSCHAQTALRTHPEVKVER